MDCYQFFSVFIYTSISKVYFVWLRNSFFAFHIWQWHWNYGSTGAYKHTSRFKINIEYFKNKAKFIALRVFFAENVYFGTERSLKRTKNPINCQNRNSDSEERRIRSTAFFSSCPLILFITHCRCCRCLFNQQTHQSKSNTNKRLIG